MLHVLSEVISWVFLIRDRVTSCVVHIFEWRKEDTKNDLVQSWHLARWIKDAVRQMLMSLPSSAYCVRYGAFVINVKWFLLFWNNFSPPNRLFHLHYIRKPRYRVVQNVRIDQSFTSLYWVQIGHLSSKAPCTPFYKMHKVCLSAFIK